MNKNEILNLKAKIDANSIKEGIFYPVNIIVCVRDITPNKQRNAVRFEFQYNNKKTLKKYFALENEYDLTVINQLAELCNIEYFEFDDLLNRLNEFIGKTVNVSFRYTKNPKNNQVSKVLKFS